MFTLYIICISALLVGIVIGGSILFWRHIVCTPFCMRDESGHWTPERIAKQRKAHKRRLERARQAGYC